MRQITKDYYAYKKKENITYNEQLNKSSETNPEVIQVLEAIRKNLNMVITVFVHSKRQVKTLKIIYYIPRN